MKVEITVRVKTDDGGDHGCVTGTHPTVDDALKAARGAALEIERDATADERKR